MNKFWVIVAGVLLFSTANVRAASNNVTICEIQTESTTSATEEFIRICNNSDTAVTLSGWYVQYFAATATSFTTPSRSIALKDSVDPSGDYVIASSGYMSTVAHVTFSATLASAGGHVRLVNGSGQSAIEIDRVGWGSAATPESQAATVVEKGKTYVRQFDGQQYVDTDNNKQDFAVKVVVPPVVENPPGTTITGVPVEITELLPDPASPVSDVEGEFVELYNPTSTDVDLVGYTLQTGLSFSYSYVFSSLMLPAHTYLALYAPTTKVTLSNTSGGARILAPNGEVIYATETYEKAPTGQSWANDNGTWSWTTTVTPDAANVITVNNVVETNSQATAKSVKAKSTKPAATKSSTKSATKTAASTTYTQPPSDHNALPINPFVLAGVGILAVGYMIYEYRLDIAHYFRRLRTNRTHRRSAGS